MQSLKRLDDITAPGRATAPHNLDDRFADFRLYLHPAEPGHEHEHGPGPASKIGLSRPA